MATPRSMIFTRVVVARDHQVLGTDVAVDDAGAMDGLESVQRLDHQAHRLARRERAARAQLLREVLAVDVLPDHVMRAVGERGEVVQRGDVRMLDLRRRARLAEEAVVRVGVAGDVRVDDLDHARSAEVRVRGQVDLAHAARAQPLHDLVSIVEDLAGIHWAPSLSRDRRKAAFPRRNA